jgi:S1-C subfamily serine protease
MADLLNLPSGATGDLIKNVAKGSPADDAGMRGGTILATIGGEPIVLGGDILLSVEGVQAGSAANLARVRDLLAGKAPGTPFKATVLRAGRVLEITGQLP